MILGWEVKKVKIKDIKLLEMELHSFCNRTCKWCANSFIDRKSNPKFLDEDLFLSLILELSLKEFQGVISFSRYNEPFAFPRELQISIKMIKSFLPNSKLVTNTNGDYDYSGFKNLEITEMDYDNKKEEVVEGNFRIMKMKHFNNRGAVLEQIDKDYKRTLPCFEPQRFVGINYDGTISPCCNIRNDIDKHKPYIMGSLKDNNLETILNLEKNTEFRERVASGDFPSPCKSCSKEVGRYTSGEGIGGKQT